MVLEFTQPPNPIFRALYYFYFKRLLPLVARLGTGSKDYGYLPASVVEFPGPEQLSNMMNGCGLRETRYHLLTGGIAAIHIGRK
jgi:demethylmenaquinone methyltransferase/2-methoxy-6-polyprenyl-1,4-benzoquinol methylase